MTEQATERSIYSGGIWSDVKQACRAIPKSLDFTGRATRTELAGYYLVSAFLLAPTISLLAAAGLDEATLKFALGAAILVPLPAATARRLHDQDMPGYGALLCAGLLATSIYSAWRDYRNGPYESFHLFADVPVLGWIVAAIAIAFVSVLVFGPGTVGPNRFGPDPRGRA